MAFAPRPARSATTKKSIGDRKSFHQTAEPMRAQGKNKRDDAVVTDMLCVRLVQSRFQ